MTITTNVEFARPEDIPQIVSFAYQSFEDNGLKGYGVETSFEKITENITDWVTSHVVLVLRNKEDSRLIDGVLCLQFTETWWSFDVVLSNALFYLPKKTRTFKNARNLLRTGMEYGIINKVPIVMDLTGKTDIEKKRKFLSYMGFEDLGTLYIFKE